MLIRSLAIVLLLLVAAVTNSIAGSAEGVYLLRDPYNQNYHFVNAEGIEIFTACYAEDFSGDLALVSNLYPHNLLYGFISPQGKLLIPTVYIKAYSFSEGFAAVQLTEKDWIYIDKTGKDAFGKTFLEAQPFSNGFGMVKLGGGKKYINAKGELQKNVPNVSVNEVKQGGAQNNGVVSFDKDEKYGLMDSTGKVILAPKYDWIGPFSEGLAYAKLGTQGMYIDTKGTLVFSIGNLAGKPFENGLAMVGVMPPPSPDDEYLPWSDCYYVNKQGKVFWKPKNELVERSLVLTPANYDPKKKYPLLFILPATTQNAAMLIENYVGSLQDKKYRQQTFNELTTGIKQEFILVLPPGYGSYQDHTGPGFSNCIARYDACIKNELAKLQTEYGIDTTKLYLAGFSLGGDLTWALMQRNPGMFKGGVVMGSRCSFYKEGSMKILAQNKAKFYFGMGGLEDEVRLKGSTNARAKLKAAAIVFNYYEIPQAGHEPLPLDKFREALNFVME